jgi:hypothetical protein
MHKNKTNYAKAKCPNIRGRGYHRHSEGCRFAVDRFSPRKGNDSLPAANGSCSNE